MLKKLQNSSKKREGFTLIELMVVIVIIGILAAVAIQQFGGATDRAKEAKAKADIRTTMSALEVYKMDNSNYPTTAETLESLVTKPGTLATWKGPYLKATPYDPYGATTTTPYSYTSDGTTYLLQTTDAGHKVTSDKLR